MYQFKRQWSQSSYGTRLTAERGRRFPDFVIVNPTGELYADTILQIVEVKKHITAPAWIEKAKEQLHAYLKATSKKVLANPDLHGLLVLQSEYRVYKRNQRSRYR